VASKTAAIAAARRVAAGFGLAVLSLVVLSLAAGGPARAQQPIVIKFSHVGAPESPKGKTAILFKELAEKYTGGRVKVEVYPNSSLYKDKEELEALQLGSVQLLAPTLSKFGPLGVREYDIFDLPFLMSDKARARQMMASPMMADFHRRLEAKGVTPLAYWDYGGLVYTANRPLIRPEDFRGLKVRIQGSKVQDAAARALGAIPQTLALADVFQALQTGVVDGQDNAPSNILTQKWYEVQKHLTVSNHTRATYAFIAGKKFWDGLPEDVREQLERAVRESTVFFNETADRDNEEALEKIKASGRVEVHDLAGEERQAWIARLMPVHQEMQSRFGRDFIERIYKASGFTVPQM
jgi:C4-dicarboxylate-binding protein DctP